MSPSVCLFVCVTCCFKGSFYQIVCDAHINFVLIFPCWIVLVLLKMQKYTKMPFMFNLLIDTINLIIIITDTYMYSLRARSRNT